MEKQKNSLTAAVDELMNELGHELGTDPGYKGLSIRFNDIWEELNAIIPTEKEHLLIEMDEVMGNIEVIVVNKSFNKGIAAAFSIIQ